MIEEAIVDAYNEAEQAVGFHATIEQHLALPFETVMLGTIVTVRKIDVSASGNIVAVCYRGRERQVIPILELPLPHPLPVGWEWIEAYRRWARGRSRHAVTYGRRTACPSRGNRGKTAQSRSRP
jgi:hypothetical protein